jgi:uncharacterized membrane protein SpoIIM required for sporulation
MKLDAFVRDREESWKELDRLVVRARRKPERLGPDGVRELGTLYRAAAADLALARRRFRGDPVVARLEQLVGRSRHLVYDAPTRRGSVIRFFRRDYWRLVAERPVFVLVALALTFAPAALAGTWARHDPPAAIGLVPEEFRPAVETKKPWHAMPADQQAEFTTFIFTNNIRVAFFAFAGGMTVGIATVILLVYNGLILGAIGGLMTGAGNTTGFIELVTAHGVLELSCIVVAGAAGLRIAWAIVEPGRRTRRESLNREARAAVGIALGTAPWLVLAGIFEGFRAPLAALGVPAVMAIGFTLGTLYWTLVATVGRRAVRDVRALSPAGTP